MGEAFEDERGVGGAEGAHEVGGFGALAERGSDALGPDVMVRILIGFFSLSIRWSWFFADPRQPDVTSSRLLHGRTREAMVACT